MRFIRPTRLRSAQKAYHRSERPGWLSSLLALGLAALLCLSSIPPGVRAQQTQTIADPEALLASKADPLLQSVRRAVSADRAAEEEKSAPESLKAPTEAPASEVL